MLHRCRYRHGVPVDHQRHLPRAPLSLAAAMLALVGLAQWVAGCSGCGKREDGSVEIVIAQACVPRGDGGYEYVGRAEGIQSFRLDDPICWHMRGESPFGAPEIEIRYSMVVAEGGERPPYDWATIRVDPTKKSLAYAAMPIPQTAREVLGQRVGRIKIDVLAGSKLLGTGVVEIRP